MGAAAVARVAVGLAALAPAAAWFATPAHPLVAIAWGSLAIAAALHGLGRAVGRAVGDPDAPVPLAIAWGLAAYLGLAGLAVALGVFDRHGQQALAAAGTAYGAWWWAARPRAWPRPRAGVMLAVAVLAIGAAALHTFGAASTWRGPFFDGDGFLLGPLERLATTGSLDDAVGLPRRLGPGGNVVLHGLAAALGDWRMAHAVDRGLGLALLFAFVLARPRSTARPYIAVVTILLASATPEYGIDLAPRWTVAAIAFALVETWRRAAPRAGLAAVVLAAGLATLAHGGLGAVAVAIAAAVADAPAAARRRTAAIAAAIAAAAVGSYLVAAIAAAHGEPGAAPPFASIHRGLAGRLVVWGLAAAAVHALAALVVRGRRDRALDRTVAALAAAALAAGVLVPGPGGAWTLVQPLGIALLFLVADIALDDPEHAAHGPAGWPGITPAAAIAVVLVALVLATTRFPVGVPPISWEDRLGRLLQDTRARATTPLVDGGPEARTYARALAAIPRGARVGLWVDRPDLVDYRLHRVIDLHTADADACVAIPAMQWHRRAPRACRATRALLPRLDLDYLVIAPSALPRDDGWTVQPLCAVWRPRVCDDPLHPLVRAGRPVDTGSDLAVIDLTGLPASR